MDELLLKKRLREYESDPRRFGFTLQYPESIKYTQNTLGMLLANNESHQSLLYSYRNEILLDMCAAAQSGLRTWYLLVLLLSPDLSVSTSFPLFPPLRTLVQLDEHVLGLGSFVAGSLLALNVSHAEVTAWIIHHTGGFLYLS